VERAVGPRRDAVGAAAGLADLGLLPVRGDPGHLLAGNLAEDDRTVGHPHRPLGKAEPVGDDLDVRHGAPSPQPLTWRAMSAQRSSRGSVASVPSQGSIATQRSTPMSRYRFNRSTSSPPPISVSGTSSNLRPASASISLNFGR